MYVYKGKNVVAIVSSCASGLLGIIIFLLAKGTAANIGAIALIILSIVGFANYFKYSIILDTGELRITKIFKGKRVNYKDIVRIMSVQAGKITITYIVDKYMDKGKWYIRGTYPPQPVENIKDADLKSLSEVISVNSYAFPQYKDMLKRLSKKVPVGCDIDQETWHIINSSGI